MRRPWHWVEKRSLISLSLSKALLDDLRLDLAHGSVDAGNEVRNCLEGIASTQLIDRRLVCDGDKACVACPIGLHCQCQALKRSVCSSRAMISP